MKKTNKPRYEKSVKDNQIIFSEVYNKGLWGKDENGKGFSGSGSTLKTTMFYIIFLEQFIKCNQIKSVLDLGCGDWTFSKHINWGNVKYLGIDVVDHIIKKNKLNFSKKNIKFKLLDFLSSDLPVYDLLICKDVLHHLDNNQIKLFLGKIHKFKYSLITNDVYITSNIKVNSEIATGGYRPVDLTKKPFNIKGKKIFEFPDKKVNAMKEVLLISN